MAVHRPDADTGAVSGFPATEILTDERMLEASRASGGVGVSGVQGGQGPGLTEAGFSAEVVGAPTSRAKADDAAPSGDGASGAKRPRRSGASRIGSRFVAVAGAGRDAEEDVQEGRRRERRAIARRLQDAGFDEAWAHWPWLLGAVAVPLGSALVRATVTPGLVAWIVGVLALALGCVFTARSLSQHLESPATRASLSDREGRRLLILQGAGCLALLCLHPWLAESPGSRGVLTGPLLAATAAVVGVLLAPMGRGAACIALLPMSEGIARLMDPSARPGAGPIWFTAATVIGGLALLEHYRWQRAKRSAMEQDLQLSTLEQERDGAIRADQEKSRFLAIASHDLRQPVHALGLFAASLERRLQGTEEEPLIRNVIRSIEGLERSFNAMLDISRLDAGTIEPNLQQFPLRDLFRRLHMHYAGQAEANGLGLRFSPGGKSVTSDPQLLERILGNLIQNAIKYTEEGGVVVVARSTETHINLEVWDTGIGIRSADLPRIFAEFYQIGQSERSRTQGLGMGLAIVKRLAQLLGYRLMVASRPGKGTMFRLSIPVGGSPEIQDFAVAADTVPMTVIEPRLVLVIDDEEPIRVGLQLLLEEWGYEAIVAATAAEAEQAVRHRVVPPDLILSDLHLGDGPDGIAAIRGVRQLCGSNVPAILVTGDTSREELRRATESGHTVLFKPLQPRKLFNALRGMVA
ncbi:hybrid sensor histidine kinase/response regulator [Roseateles chitosanitabidus]|uniref:hybrid sensor histidine kinase/response regulator n=1 Tax=Roseateles chitosanitabidus TaxID=65048 RepID=UPI0008315BC5|nr:ATP-binding protein [Roseateles chitosanitabidus]MBO9688265.1 response regulator [Roseateles chitosanitabidus]